jgi:hypothetical protein
MSKVTFEFNLPEENEEFEIFSKAMETHCNIEELRSFLRKKYKYEEMTDKEQEQVEQIYDYFCTLFPHP